MARRPRELKAATVLCGGVLLGTTLLAAGADRTGSYQGPGWYELRLDPSRKMVLRIVSACEGIYSCLYQGYSITVAEDQIARMQSITHSEKSPSGLPLSGKEHAKVLDAIDELAHPDPKVRMHAYRVLRRYFPACRPVVHEGLKHHDRRVRALSVKFLGEEGFSTEDWTPIVTLLRDPSPRVRLAAVMALRRLGPGDVEPLVEYLASEPVANNRKMAVRNLERWKDPEAIRGLVRRLRVEADHGVRVFITRALKALTGEDHGDDTEAWATFLERRDEEEHDA